MVKHEVRKNSQKGKPEAPRRKRTLSQKRTSAIGVLAFVSVLLACVAFPLSRYCHFRQVYNEEHSFWNPRFDGYLSGEADKLAPRVLAHRGGADLHPENTVGAFRAALFHGADVLEWDVRMSKDGELVVVHDASLERVTESIAKVNELTVSEIQALDAGYRFSRDGGKTFPARGKGHHIPLADEILGLFPSERHNIEIKDNDIRAATSLYKLIESHGLRDQVCVVSAHCNVINHFRKISARIVDISKRVNTPPDFLARNVSCKTFPRLCQLAVPICTGGCESEMVDIGMSCMAGYKFWPEPKANVLQLPFRQAGVDVTETNIIQCAHDRNEHVDFWVVDNRDDIRHVIKAGADGIITNRVDIVVDELCRAGYEHSCAHVRRVHDSSPESHPVTYDGPASALPVEHYTCSGILCHIAPFLLSLGVAQYLGHVALSGLVAVLVLLYSSAYRRMVR